VPTPVPHFLSRALNHVGEEWLGVGGLYRINGDALKVTAQSLQIDANDPVEFRMSHDTTELIKAYMYSLPDSVFMNRNSGAAAGLKELPDEERLGVVRATLPICNYVMAAVFVRHGLRVIALRADNMMNAGAFATCLVLLLMRGDDPDPIAANECNRFPLIMKHAEVFGRNPLMPRAAPGDSTAFARLACAQNKECLYTLRAPEGTIV